MNLSSSSSSTGKQKKSRTSHACTNCRRKKIKCDGRQPSCSSCLQLGSTCGYEEGKKRGPRKGYVQTLEERLVQMEQKLMNTPGTLYPDTMDDIPPMPIIEHLVDIFFKHINAFIPIIHHATLKQSIEDGTVSRPLLYGVLATSARFSDHPSIRTNPPYLACERFASKALSLVDANILQPTLANIQFWGIMSCLEYGRASGAMSWVYGGLAMRFCQELGYHKEKVLSSPILAKDGSVDALAMALRRRVFWSCFMIDKLACAGTHRPQCIDRTDSDAHVTNVAETILLKESVHTDIQGNIMTEDSLLNIVMYYMGCIVKYGEVNKYMNRNKPTKEILWPPIAEYRNLDLQLRSWQENLPEIFQFTQKNLEHHQRFASSKHLAIWLNCHAMWCSSMMILHRGSLAYAESDVTDDLKRRIKTSIETCHMCVDAAMGIFGAMKDLCGGDILPYTGYSAYVFATILMTSAFSRTQQDREKSRRGLVILYELIKGLSPYWYTCEKLANATKDLLFTHEKLYGNAYPNPTSQYNQPYYMPNNNEFVSGPVYNPSTFNNYGNDINFNSTEFLLDTELFGQVVLDSGNNFQSYLSQQELIPTDSSTSFQQQQQQQ